MEVRFLYVAYNRTENFRVLVLAKNEEEATKLMEEYSKDAKLSSGWEMLSIYIKDIENYNIDCDYIIQSNEYEPLYIDELL